MYRIFILTFLTLLAALNSTAYAIAIDGDLKDWIGQPTQSSNDWQPISQSIKYSVEDQSGLENNGYLNPGWGGQAYDAEAIYLKRDALNFYVAVVTGLSPSTTSYPAGDIAFDFGNDGSYEYGVIVKSDSQHTNADSDRNGGIGTRGQVYKVSQWNVGLWNDNGSYAGIGQGTQTHPTTVKSGTLLPSLAELVYQEARYNGSSVKDILGLYDGRHYLIEARIPISLFTAADLAQAFTVHWTMGCANDSISIDPPSNVPTPPILPMLAIGLLTLIALPRTNNRITSAIDF